RVANRKMLESLVKCGAFDFLGRGRAELFACIDESLAAATASQRDRASGQTSLFDDMPAPAPKSASQPVEAWTQHEAMSYEKELLGFYVTGHPLDAYAGTIAAGKYQTIVSLGELADHATFQIAGAIAQVDKKFTKKDGKPFAVAWLEDLTGTIEIVVWNDVYAKVADALVPGKVIAIQGTLDKRDDTIRATAQKVKTLAPIPADPTPVNSSPELANGRTNSALVLRFDRTTNSADLQHVRQILAATPGSTSVQLLFERAGGEVVRLDPGTDFRVDVTPELEQRLARWRSPATMAEAS
ncbi:MAG: OB-fold nucleic acid binding domain-containing protein, partial [Verrucomicrobiota bacterium]|nr:OB-fold nucleic acid binding domain-containing protein [Verrucomicrobiota bacterium]